MTQTTFDDLFQREERRDLPGSKRTTGATITVWKGEVNGKPCRIRVRPRAKIESHQFMTNGGARRR